MEITLLRDKAISSEARLLPAETYNTAHILLSHSTGGCVFVPIRSMQYLAVIDEEEIVFVDSTYKNWVAIAWSDFHPQQRSGLQEPVPYTVHYHRPDGAQIIQRLHREFALALRSYNDRQHPQQAKLIRLPKKQKSD